MLVNKIRLIFSKFRSMGLKTFAYKSYRKLYKFSGDRVRFFKLLREDPRNSFCPIGLKTGVYDFSNTKIDKDTLEDLSYIAENWLTGRYDILGSGPVSVSNGVSGDLGQLLPINRKYSSRIKKLISENYEYKCWNVDFKSGKSWPLNEPSFSCKYGNVEGVDIKVPWEFSRLQHLPQLALLATKLPKDKGIPVAQEIVDQVMDFWAFNPIYMGPNWICAMDVGIRAVNILVAIEMIGNRYGMLLTVPVQKELASLTYQHGKFIVENLEYSPELTSNHYAGDIAGLLFISFYLESNKETDCWLAFSIQEVFSEIEKQYCLDGGNFERTTSYHRLTSEMFLWSIALIRGFEQTDLQRLRSYRASNFKSTPQLKELADQSFTISESGIDIPENVLDRIFRSIVFTIDLTKPDGNVCQFGDNDSGRFIKLTPIGNIIDISSATSKYINLVFERLDVAGSYWDESCLNHSAYISAGAGLFGVYLPEKVYNCTIEKSVINIFARGKRFSSRESDAPPFLSEKYRAQRLFSEDTLVFRKVIKIKCEDDLRLTKGLVKLEYRDTGIIVYQSDSMYLAISNMPNGALGSGAHSHNDQMSIELQIDGEDVCRDPGAYLYTSSPTRRNEFRSVAAHNVMRPLSIETNRFFGSANALFAKENECRTAIFNVEDDSCSMQVEFYGIKQQRVVSICSDELTIIDKSNSDFDNKLNSFKYFSKGFGFIERVNGDIGITKITYDD